MISELQNEALNLLIHVFDDEEDYKNYLINREKGLRKEAFNHLNSFIKDFEKRDETEQRKFIKKIFEQEENQDAIYVGVPYQLKQVIDPILEKWCNSDETDERVLYWAGKFMWRLDYVRKSLEINPNFDKARVHLVENDIDRLNFATHHLPDYYCNDTEEKEDLNLCEIVEKEIQKLSSEEKRKLLLKELYFYKELIENYIEWKKEGNKSFEEWGKENNKNVDSGIVSFYYSKY